MKQVLSLFLLSVFLFSIASAITLQENTKLQPSLSNVTFIMGANLSFDSVQVNSLSIILSNSSFFSNVSSGSSNVTVYNFTDSFRKWNVSASNTTFFSLSGFSSGAVVSVEKNAVHWQNLTANISGYVEFEYNGSYPVAFELENVSSSNPSGDSSSSSGGGGGGGGAIPVYTPSSAELQAGYAKQLGVSWKVKFSKDKKTHHVVVDTIDESAKRVKITVSSGPQEKILSVGEEWKTDIDNDNRYDLFIRLDNISSRRADLFIQTISEEIKKQEITGPSKEKIDQRAETTPITKTESSSSTPAIIKVLLTAALYSLFGILLFILCLVPYLIYKKLQGKKGVVGAYQQPIKKTAT